MFLMYSRFLNDRPGETSVVSQYEKPPSTQARTKPGKIIRTG